jgi:hypothetical protein
MCDVSGMTALAHYYYYAFLQTFSSLLTFLGHRSNELVGVNIFVDPPIITLYTFHCLYGNIPASIYLPSKRRIPLEPSNISYHTVTRAV